MSLESKKPPKFGNAATYVPLCKCVRGPTSSQSTGLRRQPISTSQPTSVVHKSPSSVLQTYAEELRYDGARQRYRVRKLDSDALAKGDVAVLSDTWLNSDGDKVHGDFTGVGTAAAAQREKPCSLDPGGLSRYDNDLKCE